MNWDAILLSVRLSALTSLVLLALGIPIAWWLARTRLRWAFLIESVVALPLVLPPTVLGFYLLTVLGPNSGLGQLLKSVTGGQLAFTFEGLLVASVFYSLPFAVQPFVTSFRAVNMRLLETARALGASPLRSFYAVALPLSRTGIITGLVLSFAHTMGEFGVVLMIGGNIQGVTRTASIDVYDKVQALEYAAAGETALLLLVISYTVLAAVYLLNRRRAGSWP